MLIRPYFFLVAGLFGMALSTWLLIPPSPVDLGTFRVIGYGVSAASLLYGVIGLEFRGLVNIWAAFVRLGNISFSVFLWHWVVVTGMYHFWSVELLGVGVPAAAGFAAGAVAATLLLSRLSYSLIELPCMALGRRFGRSKLRSPMQLARPAG